MRLEDAAIPGGGFEPIGDAQDRLGVTQEQDAVRRNLRCDPLQDGGPARPVEIGQHIAAVDDVETAEGGRVVQQVERLVGHHLTNIAGQFPFVADLGEVLDQICDRQAALHLELGVEAGLGFSQHLGRQIGRQDLDLPVLKPGPFFP